MDLKTLAPRFKFGLNPPLIDGILNVLPYELVSYKGYEKPKKWSMYSSNCKIFCDLYKGIPSNASNYYIDKAK